MHSSFLLNILLPQFSSREIQHKEITQWVSCFLHAKTELFETPSDTLYNYEHPS